VAERIRRSDESGVTLVELLVVVVVLGFIGAITVGAIVTGFGAQRTSDAVGETLDGTRVAVQRIRDTLRNADEVCTSSDGTSLAIWIDDDDDGVFTQDERFVYDQDAVTGDFRRQSFDALGDPAETLLIRDDIINATFFTYNGVLSSDAADQPTDLRCDDDGVSATPTGNGDRVTAVDVAFSVDNPSGGAPLGTATTVQLRNAQLSPVVVSQPPVADLVIGCVGSTCTFDATGSVPAAGSSLVGFEFDPGPFAPSFTSTPATSPTATFDYGLFLSLCNDPTVTVTVTDANGLTDEATATASPGCLGGGSGNAAPIADVQLVGCPTANACDFSAAGSSDPDGDTLTYAWTVTSSPTGASCSPSPCAGSSVRVIAGAAGTVTASVTVNDGTVDSPPATASANVGSSVVYVNAASKSHKSKGNGQFDLDVQYSVRNGVGVAPAAGASVTVTATLFYQTPAANGNGGGGNVATAVDEVGSCTNGVCVVTFKGIKANSTCTRVEIKQVSSSTLTYDPGRNAAGVSPITADPATGVTC
jgi:plastocyanin